jgi:hypothetical protein
VSSAGGFATSSPPCSGSMTALAGGDGCPSRLGDLGDGRAAVVLADGGAWQGRGRPSSGRSGWWRCGSPCQSSRRGSSNTMQRGLPAPMHGLPIGEITTGRSGTTTGGSSICVLPRRNNSSSSSLNRPEWACASRSAESCALSSRGGRFALNLTEPFGRSRLSGCSLRESGDFSGGYGRATSPRWRSGCCMLGARRTRQRSWCWRRSTT